MRNPFARFLTSKEEPKAKPKGKYIGSKEVKFKLFDTRKKDMAEFETIYNQGGMVTEAINTYPLYILTNGYRFEGEDEALVQMVEDKCEEIDLDACIYQGVVDALVFGDAYQEIAPSKTEAVGMVYPRPAKTFETKYDEFGVITGYEQTVNEGWSKGIPIPFAPEEIIHIALSRVGGSPTGTSLIFRCKDEIMRDARIAESNAAAVERHGFPKYHVRVGQEGEDIPKEDMLSIANQFQDLKQMNEFVTVRDVEIQSIDTQAINVNDYNNWAVQRLCSALGVPEEMLGLGRGSTEATANVRLQAFYDKIGTYQKRVARIYNSQLIDKITGEPGAVKLVFNDVSPVDEELKARWITNVMSATPGDWFAILPRQWVRDQFDIDSSEYPDEEEEPLDENEPGLFPKDGQQPEEIGGNQDVFEMPQGEEKALGMGNTAACKAARTRGDKLGPACGGSDEPSKKREKKAEPDSKKKASNPDMDTQPTTTTSQENPGSAFKRGEHKLSEKAMKDFNYIRENRQKIGRPALNYSLGHAGETVMHDLFDRLKAHTRWSSVLDLSNSMLYDVKCLNPKSESTPVQPHALQLKQEATKKSGKKWAFPVMVAREDRTDVYLHEAPEVFYSLDPEKGEFYSVPVNEKEYIGYYDNEGTFHEGKK